MALSGRIIACLSVCVILLAASTVTLALRLAEAPSPRPSEPARVSPAPSDAAEIRRLGASIEATGQQMAQLREALSVPSSAAVGAAPAPDDLSRRLAQTERNVEEMLRIIRQFEQLVSSAMRERNPAYGATPNPADPLGQRRSIATSVKNDLRLIDAAVDQYAIEFNVSAGLVTFDQIKRYFRADTKLARTGQDALGSVYGPNFTIGSVPRVPPATKNALRDVADDQFWSPFQ